MRTAVLIVALAFLLYDFAGNRKAARAASASVVGSAPNLTTNNTPPARIDFDSQIKPIFKSKCMPCHFSRGQMYERLPFDRPETVKKLGDKLFTRIKDEDQRRLLREFLEQ